MKSDKDNWLKDYIEYSQLGKSKVPHSLVKSVKSRLFPNPWRVFGKVVFLHSIIGFLSLSICNQFGLNPFRTDRSLMDYFMDVGGHNFCMVACGIFFMTTTYLLSNLIVNLEELETIRKYQWLQTSLLGLSSLAVFFFFGAELVLTFAGLWILGAFLGSLAAIEGSYFFRRQWT